MMRPIHAGRMQYPKHKRKNIDASYTLHATRVRAHALSRHAPASRARGLRSGLRERAQSATPPAVEVHHHLRYHPHSLLRQNCVPVDVLNHVLVDVVDRVPVDVLNRDLVDVVDHDTVVVVVAHPPRVTAAELPPATSRPSSPTQQRAQPQQTRAPTPMRPFLSPLSPCSLSRDRLPQPAGAALQPSGGGLPNGARAAACSVRASRPVRGPETQSPCARACRSSAGRCWARRADWAAPTPTRPR